VKRPSNARIAGDVVPMAGLAVASLALSTAVIIRRPDLVMGADVLFQDAGHNLLVADRMLSGASLYSDVFYPYGPVSAYLYALGASLFGNTPTVYLCLLAGISAANICLAYWLIRRAADRKTAVLIGIAMLAVLPIPGAIAGAFTSSPFLVLERTLLLLVALSWRPPAMRGLAPSLAIGIALGLWQGVKFGGAVVAGAAVMLLILSVAIAVWGRQSNRVRGVLRAANGRIQ
jgi:4-amino-4-deoxy-L-arabinose transferase-like glycosyltransferase